MGKSKRNRRKKSRAALQSSSREEKLDALLEQAKTAMESFNPDEAESKLNELLEMDPDNLKGLQLLACVYCEKFRIEEAKDLLNRCIAMSPESGYVKYFTMAELAGGGLESLRHYEKGIQVLEKEIEQNENENVEPSEEQNKAKLLRYLSDAYCSISEIYITDCCNVENAEQKCFAAIEAAIRSDPSNPEVYQSLANYQLEKDQLEDARESMEKSFSLWLPLLEGEGEENNLPQYDSRIKTSKLLMEVQMYNEAAKVLESLLGDDDEVVEVWYLFGWLYYVQGGDENRKDSRFYFRQAKEVYDKRQGEASPEDDDRIQHIAELLAELDACYPPDSDKENEDEDEEDSFATDSEEEVEEMETTHSI